MMRTIILLSLLVNTVLQSFAQNKLYGTDSFGHSIWSSNTDGSAFSNLIQSPITYPQAIDIDGSFIYWYDDFEHVIFRSNLDGSNKTSIVEAGSVFELMVYNNQIYFMDFFGPEDEGIYRVDIDGSNMTKITGASGFAPTGFAIDTVNQKLYVPFPSFSPNVIGSVNKYDLDGSNEEITNISGNILDLVVTGNELIVLDLAFSEFAKYDLNGDNYNSLLDLSAYGFFLESRIDTDGTRIYWALPNGTPEMNTIISFNTDGSDLQTIYTSAASPLGETQYNLAVDSGKVYTVSNSSGYLIALNSDGSGLETIYERLFISPTKIESLSDRLIFIDIEGQEIFSMNPDGTNLVSIMDNNISFSSKLDTSGGMIYWSSGARLYSSMPDGSGVAFTDLGQSIRDFTIYGSTVYYVTGSFNNYTISSANLDGTNSTVLISDVGLSAISANDSNVFWADNEVDAIRRMNLDGTDVTNLYSYTGNVFAMTLDSGKVYFSVVDDSLYSMNTDGSGLQNLGLSGLLDIQGLTVNDFGTLGTLNSSQTAVEIQVYPNPFVHEVHIQSNNSTVHKVELYNLAGQKVAESGANTKVLNINHLKSGVYFLAIETNKGSFTEKLIKR